MATNYPNDFWYPVPARTALWPWKDELGDHFDSVVHTLEDRDRELEAWTHYHYNCPAVRVHSNANTNLANNTSVALPFDDTVYDPFDMHVATANTRITFQRPGVYQVFGGTSVTGETDYTSVVLFIRLNGTTIISRCRFVEPGVAAADQPHLECGSAYKFIEGDYIELVINQENTSANAETTVAGTTYLGATWISTGLR